VTLPIQTTKQSTFEVWAQLLLSDADCERLREFSIQTLGIKPRHVVKRMHITVYHARRPMPGLSSTLETVSVVVSASETRFMVMAPGGENPRPHLDPAARKIGIRVHRQSLAMPQIQDLRQRLLEYETPDVLGKRSPSTHRSNAFGARSFQPHMTLLRAGSGVNQDLTLIGVPFRQKVGDLHFDRFQIEIVQRKPELLNSQATEKSS
jgi:hypothetical protein